jgi:hypothetical protein
VVNTKIHEMDFLQENYMLQPSDRGMDNPTANKHISHQQELHRQNTEFNRQRDGSSRTHTEEGQETQLQSQQGDTEDSRQLIQTDGVVNRSATRGAKDLPQQGEDDTNMAMSASSVTPSDRPYNIQSWLVTPKDGASIQRKGTQDVNSSTHGLDGWQE